MAHTPSPNSVVAGNVVAHVVAGHVVPHVVAGHVVAGQVWQVHLPQFSVAGQVVAHVGWLDIWSLGMWWLDMFSKYTFSLFCLC